jgi:predicted dehydrogenase
MEKLKVVAIGSGWVVSHRHVPSIIAHGDKVELVALVGRKSEKLQATCQKYKIPLYIEGDSIENADKWLDKCDAVTIGTDPKSHYKIAKFCLQNGKHVLMEKPMTLGVEQSTELVELAKSKNLKFAIVHNFQFSDCAKKLDNDIASGKLGELKSINATQFSNPHRRLPSWYEDLLWGLFFDESPHLLYLLDKYAQGITFDNAVKWNSTENMNTPAMVNADFKSSLGIPVHMYLNFEARISEWYLSVMGTKGTGIIDVFRDTYIFLPDDGLHTPKNIIYTSFKTISDHLLGTVSEIFKVLGDKAFFGNDHLFGIYFDSILSDKPLGKIDAYMGLKINKLQFEIMEKAKVL